MRRIRMILLAACAGCFTSVGTGAGVWAQDAGSEAAAARKGVGVVVEDAQGKPMAGARVRSMAGKEEMTTGTDGWFGPREARIEWRDVIVGERAFKVWMKPAGPDAALMYTGKPRPRVTLPVGACPADGVELAVKITRPDGAAAGGAWVCVHTLVRLDDVEDWSWLWVQADSQGMARMVMPRKSARLANEKVGLGLQWLEMQAVTMDKEGYDTGLMRVRPTWGSHGRLGVEIQFKDAPARMLEGVTQVNAAENPALVGWSMPVYQSFERPADLAPLLKRMGQDRHRPVWWNFARPRQIPEGGYSAYRTGETWRYAVSAETGVLVARDVLSHNVSIPKEEPTAYVTQPSKTVRMSLSAVDREGVSVTGINLKVSAKGKSWSKVVALTGRQYEGFVDVPQSIPQVDLVFEVAGSKLKVSPARLVQRYSTENEHWEVCVGTNMNGILSGWSEHDGSWRLTDAAGRPIAGATVEFAGFGEPRKFTTGSDGKLKNVDASRRLYVTQVTVTAPGMGEMRLPLLDSSGAYASGGVFSPDHDWGDDRTRSLVRLPVLLQADAKERPHFAGTVVGPDGKPVAGCEVWINRAITQPGRWDMADTWRGAGVVTDAGGRFASWPIEPWHDVACHESQSAKMRNDVVTFPWPVVATYSKRWLAVVRPPAGSGLGERVVEVSPGGKEPVTVRLEPAAAVNVRAVDLPGAGGPERMRLVRMDEGTRSRVSTRVMVGQGPAPALLSPGSYRLETGEWVGASGVIEAGATEAVLSARARKVGVNVEVVEAGTRKPITGALVCGYALQPGGWSEVTWEALAKGAREEVALAVGLSPVEAGGLCQTGKDGKARVELSGPAARGQMLYVYARGYAPMQCIMTEDEGLPVVFELPPGGRVRIVPDRPVAAEPPVARRDSVWEMKGPEPVRFLLLEQVGRASLQGAPGVPEFYLPGKHWPEGATLILPKGAPVSLAGFAFGADDYGAHRSISHHEVWYRFPAIRSFLRTGWGDRVVGVGQAQVTASDWRPVEVALRSRMSAGVEVQAMNREGMLLRDARVQVKVEEAGNGGPVSAWSFQGWSGVRMIAGTRVTLTVERDGKLFAKPEWVFDVPQKAERFGPVVLVVE